MKEDAEKEEAKPEVKKASSKKEVEEEEDDKREHVNIIFIGHVGKSFVCSITLLFLWNMNIIIRNGSKLSLSFFFQMLENQQLVVMLCKLQCMCCVRTFVFGIFFPIFPAVGAPPLDLGVSYKFHATVLCQHCVKNKIRNVTLLCYLSYHNIKQIDAMSSNSFCKRRLHGDVFSTCQVDKCFIFCV